MARHVFSRSRLFLGFLAIGLLSGFFLGNLSQASAAARAESKNLQQNTLIVFVDDLSGEHHTVRGIWLAARVEGSPELSWMPIYPTPLGVGETEYSQAHTALILESFEFEDLTFLTPLHDQRVWWDEIFIIDAAALANLQTLAGIEHTNVAETWLEPQRALHKQVQLLQGMCAASPTAANQIALDQILALIPSHIQITQSTFELITRWDAWSQTGFALSCTHPWAN
ncbi:MAG: hypothetical protein WEC37_02770 [Anaerolineales bacterium]